LGLAGVNLLVVNVGSSSVKLDVVNDDDVAVASHESSGAPDIDEVRRFADAAPTFTAVGHRIVHGGTQFTEARRIDERDLDALDALDDMAPLHNPPALALLRAMVRSDGDRPNVACFDTTFHATIPEHARTYAIPAAWRAAGVRRFGFHGLSHAYANRRAIELLGLDPTASRIVSCHLGAGASVAAIVGGRSVDTSMGFTPVEGLVMASRSGDVDPGAIAWLLARGHVDTSHLEHDLDEASGLRSLCGTGDMRVVVERADAGDEDASHALAVYVHRLVKHIGAMTAAMGGIHALVFTGGVGEHAPVVRRRTCESLDFLGVAVDVEHNAVAAPDADVTAHGAAVRVAVVHAREAVEIARQVRGVLRG
jgi:acetate kinase